MGMQPSSLVETGCAPAGHGSGDNPVVVNLVVLCGAHERLGQCRFEHHCAIDSRRQFNARCERGGISLAGLIGSQALAGELTADASLCAVTMNKRGAGVSISRS